MKPGTKVVVHYPGSSLQLREVGRAFRDGSFKLKGGLHRYRLSPDQGCAVRVGDREIIVTEPGELLLKGAT